MVKAGGLQAEERDMMMNGLSENQIICGDCLEVMKNWPDKCVDLIVVDPPFNVGKDYGETTNDNRIDYWKWIELRFKEAYRILRDDTRLYSFNTDKGMFEFKPILEEIGFDYVQTLIWYGPNLVGGRGRISSDWHYMHEPIILMRKGKRTPMISSEFSNCYSVQVHIRPQSNFKEGRFHIAEKPLSLLISILSRTPGKIVCDFCCGVGTTCVAAKKLGRRYIGIDISPEYCRIAEERLKAVDTGVPVKEARAGQKALFE